MAIAAGQAGDHPLEGAGDRAVVARPVGVGLVPEGAAVLSLQADHRLEPAVVGSVDEVNPAGLRPVGLGGDAVEELLDPGPVAHQLPHAIQLPTPIPGLAAFLDEGVHAVEAVAAPLGDGEVAPGEVAAADAGIAAADEDAVGVDAAGAGLIAETAGQGIHHGHALRGHVARVGQGDGVGHGAAGSGRAGIDRLAEGDHRPGHRRRGGSALSPHQQQD